MRHFFPHRCAALAIGLCGLCLPSAAVADASVQVTAPEDSLGATAALSADVATQTLADTSTDTLSPDVAPPVVEPAASDSTPDGSVSVVVTGTRTPRRTSEDPIGTEVVTARELAARNVRDASQSLAAEPGVQLERSFRGAAFQLRGLESKYVRLLADGMPIVGQVNDVIDLRRYPMEGVERIEVVRGAASALYGSDALAGVINLVSRRPRQAAEASGFAQYGQLNQSAAGLYAGSRQGALGLSLTLNWAGQDSYDLTPGDDDLSTQGDARRAAVGVGRLFWAPSAALEVMAFVRGGLFDTRGVDLQLPRALWNRRVGEGELAVGSATTWRPDDATRVTLLAQANGFGRSFYRQQRQGPGLDDQQTLEQLQRGELQLDRTLGAGRSLTGGVGGQRSRLDSPRLTGGGAEVATGWIFGQLLLASSLWGELVAGGRVDADSTFGTQLTPRVAGRLSLARWVDGLVLRGSYGQGFRAPSLGERFLDFANGAANYVVRGNAALSPERSAGWQAGLEWAPGAGRGSGRWLPTLKVTAHRQELAGLIQAVDLSGRNELFQYRNYAAAVVQGLEASVRLMSGRGLVADAGGAWLDARGTLDGRQTRLPGRAAWQWTAALLYSRPESGTDLSLRGQWQLDRTALDPESPVAPAPLVIVDAKLAQRLPSMEGGPDWAAYLSVENITDSTDRDFLNLPGRLFLAGLQGRY